MPWFFELDQKFFGNLLPTYGTFKNCIKLDLQKKNLWKSLYWCYCSILLKLNIFFKLSRKFASCKILVESATEIPLKTAPLTTLKIMRFWLWVTQTVAQVWLCTLKFLISVQTLIKVQDCKKYFQNLKYDTIWFFF